MTTAPTNDPAARLQRHIGRQPIFNRSERVMAYELLFRAGTENAYSGNDGDAATVDVINSTLNVMGLHSLTRGRQGFINITERVLLEQAYTVLPPEHVVLELLEDIQPEPQVVKACQRLKQQGYTLALDDYTCQPGYDPLLELADIIKVDLSQTTGRQRAAVAETYGRQGVQLLAEKVETREDFDESIEQGYTLFQGYFFQKPQVVSARDVPAYTRNYLTFLQKVNAHEVDFDELEQIIKQDLSLSTKLLRYLNSAYFGLGTKVRSIKQALVMLGEEPLRKWASVVALTCLGVDRPDELVVGSLVRARFCEGLCQHTALAGRELDLFMLGLLSLIDSVTSQPLDEILMEMPVPRDVRAALLGSRTLVGQIYSAVQCCERDDPSAVAELGQAMGVPAERIHAIYGESIAWADEIFGR